MPSTLTTNAIEASTYAITVTFTDENDSPLTPNTVTWTLTTTDGTVVNSRQDVSETPDTSVTIVLSGDDLALNTAGNAGNRILTVEGTFDSDLGSGLPYKEQAIFEISNLTAVT